jgi:hypothetical protein
MSPMHLHNTHTHTPLPSFFGGVKNIRCDMHNVLHNVYKLCIAKFGKLRGPF